MCSDCGTNPPLIIVCKSKYHAETFLEALDEIGGSLVNSHGENVPATRDGDTVTIPWNGNPMVMAQLGEMAAALGFAEFDECQAMGDRAAEAMTGIPVAVLRALRDGQSFADAVRPLMTEPPEDKVEEMISTLMHVLDQTSDADVKFVAGDLLD